MASDIKFTFLRTLQDRFGTIHKLGSSQSLYEIGNAVARIYIRYSAVHEEGKTFYGLRRDDLVQLEGFPSLICFLWDGQTEPLMLPFADYADIFRSVNPANDGQYKVQVLLRNDQTILYIARAGKFNVDAHLGWHELNKLVASKSDQLTPSLSHSQVQTLLGAIGSLQGLDIWIPVHDRSSLAWSLTGPYRLREALPHGLHSLQPALQQIDVIWMHRGSNHLHGLFEIEHSTTIYSGLLRLNDIFLKTSLGHARYHIVAYRNLPPSAGSGGTVRSKAPSLSSNTRACVQSLTYKSRIMAANVSQAA